MRALTICAAILLTLVPTTSAHDNPPPDPTLLGHHYCQISLPLWDYAMCQESYWLSAATQFITLGLPWTVYTGHQAGCHVVGGPACIM